MREELITAIQTKNIQEALSLIHHMTAAELEVIDSDGNTVFTFAALKGLRVYL